MNTTTGGTRAPPASSSQPPKFLERVRLALERRGIPPALSATCVDFVRRCILFHGKRHPQDLGPPEIDQFLDHLAHAGNAASAAVCSARPALQFVYEEVLPLRDE